MHRHPPLGDYETEARASALKVAVIQFLATDALTAVGAHSHSVFVEVKTVFIEINCNLQLTYNND